MLHTTFLDSLNLFLKSDLFTPEEKVELVRVENVSPDELAVGTLRQLEQICVMLNLKKKKQFAQRFHSFHSQHAVKKKRCHLISTIVSAKRWTLTSQMSSFPILIQF